MVTDGNDLEEDDGVDDMTDLGLHLSVDPEILSAFQIDLKEFLASNLKRLDAIFAKHPGMLEVVAEYGLKVQIVPFEVEVEPEYDSGLH